MTHDFAIGRNQTLRRGDSRAGSQLYRKLGETLGLLGQNGAGKTTTLNIITGYLAPTSGDVRVGDYDLLTQPRQAKRLIGYLPEQPPLYDEMTVESYLRFVCRLAPGGGG